MTGDVTAGPGSGSQAAVVGKIGGKSVTLAGSMTTTGGASGITYAFPTGGPFIYTFPSANDTLVGRASTDTLTNKTVNCANNTCTVRIGSDVSGLGTGVATALANAANASGGVCTVGGGGCAGGGSSTGFGVDGGGSPQTVTSTGTVANSTRQENIGTLSGAITRTLPAISAVSTDTGICFLDAAQNIGATNTLTITANAADSIGGGSTGGSIGPYTTLGSGVCLKVSAAHNWTAFGTLAAGNGLTLNGMNKATSGQLGTVQGDGSTITINGSGVESCTTATTGQLGCVKPDGSTITISAGVISSSGGTGTVVKNHITGLILSNDGTTPNSVLDISAGQAADSTNAVYIAPGAFTKTTSGAWVSGTGNAGMGNGLTIASNTQYYVCLANNGGTPDYWFDTSSSCANRPSGISDTKYRLAGAFHTCYSTASGGGGPCSSTSTNIAPFASRPIPGGTITYWNPSGSLQLPHPFVASAVSASAGSPTAVTLDVPLLAGIEAKFSVTFPAACVGIRVTDPLEPNNVVIEAAAGPTTSANIGDAYTQNTSYLRTDYVTGTNASGQINLLANTAASCNVDVWTKGWKWDRGINGS